MLDFSGLRNQNAQAKVGKTQKVISANIGINESRYSQIIKGSKKPTLTEIDKMCKGFTCQVCDLVEYREV